MTIMTSCLVFMVAIGASAIDTNVIKHLSDTISELEQLEKLEPLEQLASDNPDSQLERYHIWSDPGHETVSWLALGELHKGDPKAVNLLGLDGSTFEGTTPEQSKKLDKGAIQKKLEEFQKDPLGQGAQWNDMPLEDENKQEASHAVNFAVTASIAEHTGDQTSSIAAEAHFGQYQHFHSMCPVVKAGLHVWDNCMVKQAIYKQASQWWMESFQTSHEMLRFKLGHFLHMVQDSYSAAHTVRGPESKSLSQDAGLKCGRVYTFQGYTLQDGGKHDLTDFVFCEKKLCTVGKWDSKNIRDPAFKGTRRRELFDCAVRYSRLIIEQWLVTLRQLEKQGIGMSNKNEDLSESEKQSKADIVEEGWGNMKKVLADVYDLRTPELQAGGSAKAYENKALSEKRGPYDSFQTSTLIPGTKETFEHVPVGSGSKKPKLDKFWGCDEKEWKKNQQCKVSASFPKSAWVNGQWQVGDDCKAISNPTSCLKCLKTPGCHWSYKTGTNTGRCQSVKTNSAFPEFLDPDKYKEAKHPVDDPQEMCKSELSTVLAGVDHAGQVDAREASFGAAEREDAKEKAISAAKEALDANMKPNQALLKGAEAGWRDGWSYITHRNLQQIWSFSAGADDCHWDRHTPVCDETCANIVDLSDLHIKLGPYISRG